ncbi:MAG: Dabb family protein [Acidimicrobiia bacterium]
MIRHIAMLGWTDDITSQRIDAIEEALRKMPTIMPFIRNYELHRDLGINSSHDFVVIAEFDSADDYHVYAGNPQHQAVIDELIKPVMASIARVQVAI